MSDPANQIQRPTNAPTERWINPPGEVPVNTDSEVVLGGGGEAPVNTSTEVTFVSGRTINAG